MQRIPTPRVRPVKVNEKSGIVFERSPEEDAFHTWINKDFKDIETIYAKQWREELTCLDLDVISKKQRGQVPDFTFLISSTSK